MRLLLFFRLMIRPLLREPVRTALTVFAVALGVAVVMAIDLAGNAATGSFRSSMETLAGDNDLELKAAGGVPEEVVGRIATLPYAFRVTPRIEDFALLADTKRSVPLIGIDLVAAGSELAKARTVKNSSKSAELTVGDNVDDALKYLGKEDSIWAGASLGRKVGERVTLVLNDTAREYIVRGVFDDANGNEAAIVMDIAAAQSALQRFGRVDRVLIKVPETKPIGEWEELLRQELPEGVELARQGSGTEENRRMLAAFGWNLRLLSYIALVVGAFLIYNTISVSVVRRRADVGIVRALGASRGMVLAAFLGEAAAFGIAGAAIGLPLGRVMASGAVKSMAATVQALYVSSKPGPITLSTESVALALAIGLGVALVSAYSPAREAAMVPPVEAMARGRREYEVRVHKKRDLWIAMALGVSALLASRAPAIQGKPLFGYLATILSIAAAALAIPAFVAAVTRVSARMLRKALGVEGLLASRSLGGSLRRTSVLVGALATAVAMMVAVGIMVGSFRETVVLWMGNQVPADLYIGAASDVAPDRHPTISPELVDTIAKLPGVAAVDRLRAYEISYEGMPATLVAMDLSVLHSYHEMDFLSGQPSADVLEELRGKNAVIVSEPFTAKHHVRGGDSITLPLGTERPSFRILDVYYDYSSERGYVVMDRTTLLKYLPDPAPSNLAVFVKPDADAKIVREELESAAAGRRILIFSNRDLRNEAIQIFDRTFAITYALEGVAVLVAVMGVAGALLALVIDRRREIGLLRFFGAAATQVRKLILVEAGLLGLLANAAGLALGFLLSLILIYVINKQSFGWTIRFHWPVAVLLGALTLVYGATVLAGFYPAQIAVELNPLEVVHEE